MKFMIIYFAVSLVTLPVNSVKDQNITTEQWLEDLDFVVTNLKSNHPNLYYRISEEEFDTVVTQAREEIRQAQSDLECYFAIRRIVASIKDGHTVLTQTGGFDIVDLRFPFRLDIFTDGIFITVISTNYKQYLGSRVISINGKPIEEVIETTREIVSMDNEFGQLRPALMAITFARIMYGLGITDCVDSIELELITADGEPAALTVESIADSSSIGWSNRLNVGPTTNEEYFHPAALLGDQTPLHLRKHGSNYEFYWFEHLDEERAIYFQFNLVLNQPGDNETLVQFLDSMWSYIDEHADEVDKLIIDIRYNDGGTGLFVLPLVNEIIRRDNINNRNSLFVLIGKRTYSAAVVFLTELALHTEAVFIGDPTACPDNMFSNSISVGNLPNSGFNFLVASRQIDNAWLPQRVYFPPDIPAPFSSQDYFSGNDPALEIALQGGMRTVSEFAAEEGADAAFEYYNQLRERYSNLDWWTALNPEILESDINQSGYELLQNQNLAAAFEVFKLNTMIFPDSFNVWDCLGECCYNMENYNLSLEYYNMSIEINPNNENGIRMIERIMQEQGESMIPY